MSEEFNEADGLDPQEVTEQPGYQPPAEDPTDPEPQPGDENYVEPYADATRPTKEILP